jgi:hypothetical protein
MKYSETPIEIQKKVQLDLFRKKRNLLLQELDVAFLIALEKKDEQSQKEIAAKKQALRDVTKTDLPNTLEEIKDTWPEILGKNPFNK